MRGIFYFILYAVALVDVYCFVKFHSSLTPTMLLLVGETDSREAGEFLRSCVSPDVLFSNVGWVVLVMFIHLLVALAEAAPVVVLVLGEDDDELHRRVVSVETL